VRANVPRNPALSLAMIVAPIAVMLIQFAISRAREFDADRGGAVISGEPRMIVNPLTGGGVAGLFNTHPSTDERVARLRAMAAA